MTVRVEPGVVLDQLNAHLKPLGLMFGPDVSTSDRATLGGMIGNNSAGARSLRYGKTVDHVRAVEVVLADGTPATLGPVAADELDARLRPARPRRRGPSRGPRHGRASTATAIAARFPQILRRVSGYNLDEFVPGLPVRPVGWVDEPWQFNLARLIVGSEGTLAVVTGGRAEGRADPAGAGAGRPLVRHDPRGARPAGRDRRDRAGGRRDARPDDPRPRRRATRSTRTTSTSPRAGPPPSSPPSSTPTRPTSWPTGPTTWPGGSRGGPGVLGVRKSLTDAAKDDFWKVRKAGFSLLMAHGRRRQAGRLRRGHGRRPDRLPEFYERFRAIVARHGVAGRLLRPRRRRLPAHPADHQRQDRARGSSRSGRSRARSPTWSSSSAAR